MLNYEATRSLRDKSISDFKPKIFNKFLSSLFTKREDMEGEQSIVEESAASQSVQT